MTQAEIDAAIARLRNVPAEDYARISLDTATVQTALACLRDYVPREDRETSLTWAFQSATLPMVDALALMREARRLSKLEPHREEK